MNCELKFKMYCHVCATHFESVTGFDLCPMCDGRRVCSCKSKDAFDCVEISKIKFRGAKGCLCDCHKRRIQI